MPRSSIRNATQPSQSFRSELRHGPKGKVYMSIAHSGRQNGCSRKGLRELLSEGQNRLLTPASQNKVNTVLAQRKKEAYESTLTSS